VRAPQQPSWLSAADRNRDCYRHRVAADEVDVGEDREAVDVLREEGATRTHSVELRLVDAGRDCALVTVGFGAVYEPAPGADDHVVRGAKVLLGAVVDLAHG